jgi:cobalt-zinc-cadmium resistance protein CzcA
MNKLDIKTFFLLTIMLLVTIMAKSQVTEITMAEAVEIALVSNPGLIAGQLAVQQQEALKKSAFDFGDTRINYTRGELNTRIIDYEIQISQGFSLNYLSQANLQKEKIKLSESDLYISRSELIRDVRSTFTLLQLSKLKLAYIDSLEGYFSRFAHAANLKYRTGESNMLEKTAAIGKQQEVVLLGKQAEAEVSIYTNLLHKLLNSKDSLGLSGSSIIRLTNISLSDLTLVSNPQLKMIRQRVNLAQQYFSTEKSKFISAGAT